MKKTIILISILLSLAKGWAQPKYITTIHPFEAIVNSLTGDRGVVFKLLPPGASPHTYDLRPSDVRRVESATALIIGGENLDEWALSLYNANIIELLNLIPVDSLINIHDDEATAHEDHHKHHHDGIDPHFWTDPLLVKSLLPSLTERLCALDPEGSGKYIANMNAFSCRLDSLNAQIQNLLAPYTDTAVMLSHPFFRYFFRRYDIKLVGIIETSPGTEPSPRELKKDIDRIENESVRVIFTHPQLSDRPAWLIAESTGVRVCQLDPIGGVEGRLTYEELILFNANKIAELIK